MADFQETGSEPVVVRVFDATRRSLPMAASGRGGSPPGASAPISQPPAGTPVSNPRDAALPGATMAALGHWADGPGT